MTTYTQVWDHMTNKVSETMIVRDEDGAFIPFDDGNTDYQKYKAWLEEGNIPAKPDRPKESKDSKDSKKWQNTP